MEESPKENKFPCGVVHTEMDFEERDEMFNKFKTSQVKIIITCDYYKKQYALNKDFCIINYDLPSVETNSKYTVSGYYTLRIKSSGSLGNKGLVVNFVTEETKGRMEQIKESFMNVRE